MGATTAFLPRHKLFCVRRSAGISCIRYMLFCLIPLVVFQGRYFDSFWQAFEISLNAGVMFLKYSHLFYHHAVFLVNYRTSFMVTVTFSSLYDVETWPSCCPTVVVFWLVIKFILMWEEKGHCTARVSDVIGFVFFQMWKQWGENARHGYRRSSEVPLWSVSTRSLYVFHVYMAQQVGR